MTLLFASDFSLFLSAPAYTVSLTQHQLLASPNHLVKRRPRPPISAIAYVVICLPLGRLLYHAPELGLTVSIAFSCLMPFYTCLPPCFPSAEPQMRSTPDLPHVQPRPDRRLRQHLRHPRDEKGAQVRIICQLTTSPVLCRPLLTTSPSSRHGHCFLGKS